MTNYYSQLVATTQQAIAMGITVQALKLQIKSAQLTLQTRYMFSAKGGFGGLPNSDKIQSKMRAFKKLELNLPSIARRTKRKSRKKRRRK